MRRAQNEVEMQGAPPVDGASTPAIVSPGNVPSCLVVEK
jgi:hypothetical protein